MTETLSMIQISPLVKQALEEDLGRGGDITSNAVIPKNARAKVAMVARQEGRIAGLDLARLAFEFMDPELNIHFHVTDGADVQPGDKIMTVEGNARAILSGERVGLNFVGKLSGIATLTRDMVKATGNYKAKIAATRKTTPGLRVLEKYAVQVGGGAPHRMGLDDAVMIKDNHIAMAGGLQIAVERAKESVGHTVKIEVEVDTLEQLDELIEIGADIVLLDNMDTETLEEAVRRVNGKMIIEASGGVTMATIPSIAATGVDYISVGALTHSAPNMDVGLDYLH